MRLDEGVERLDVPDALEDTFTALYEQGWTDGLPVIPPTPERVERMLGGVRGEPGMVVASVPPAQGEATLQAIAVNAVMAGCVPEYMPVLVAAVRAACRPEFNLGGIQGTTDPVTPGLLLNGPIRTRLEINCREGAAGPGWRANATIGRALRLILQNVGGARPGVGDKATLGQPAKYAFCLGENEEQSPWEPLHVERGFRPADSTVTAVAVNFVQTVGLRLRKAEDAIRLVAGVIPVMGHGNDPVTLVLPPEAATLMAEQGFSKARVKEFLYERARVPLSRIPRGEQLYPTSSLIVEGDHALAVRRPEDIVVVVAGGLGYALLYLDGWLSIPVTEVIAEADGATAVNGSLTPGSGSASRAGQSTLGGEPNAPAV